jgi:hypothetical protein
MRAWDEACTPGRLACRDQGAYPSSSVALWQPCLAANSQVEAPVQESGARELKRVSNDRWNAKDQDFDLTNVVETQKLRSASTTRSTGRGAYPSGA